MGILPPHQHPLPSLTPPLFLQSLLLNQRQSLTDQSDLDPMELRLYIQLKTKI
jgi:hypothetical protein